MMAADYRHIGGSENRLGRHYSRLPRFSPRLPLLINHLLCETFWLATSEILDPFADVDVLRGQGWRAEHAVRNP
jgi:hypothetical protein